LDKDFVGLVERVGFRHTLRTMLESLLADLVVTLHVAFVVFVLTGGILALKWPSIMRFHLPAAVWGAFVEFSGLVCPLTPLEHWFHERAGAKAYETDFLSRYLIPLLYPEALTRNVQIVLGLTVIVVNGGLYLMLWHRRRRAMHPLG